MVPVTDHQVFSGWSLSQPEVPRRVPEKKLSLSSLEGSNLVPMRCLLLFQGAASSFRYLFSFGGWSVLQVSTAPFGKWEVSVTCHKDAISSVLSGIQDDPKVTAKRMT
jgi:hypothetical protein